MEDSVLDKIILGHNQFFGINHMSSERGVVREQYFSNINNIIGLIKYAYSQGAGGLMLSTHERSREIAEGLRKDTELANNLHLYILLPYMAKYVRKANERGFVNMIFETLESAGWSERISMGFKGGIGMLKQDPFSMMKAMIDIELLPFKGLNIKAVFLHNSLTDLAIGLGLFPVLDFFNEYISTRHRTSPAFCTLTSGLTMPYFHSEGLLNPIIMAPFNPAGFQMSPSKEACEEALHRVPARVVAMSILAAGYVKPSDACAYLATLPEIKSVIVGASSESHIDEIFESLTVMSS
jgi:hypothetical protein